MNLAVVAKNDDERKLVRALLDKPLANFEGKEDFAKLIAVVTKWRIMIGLSKEMSAEELKLNVAFIKENYPKFTLKDIDLAMNWSLQGRLDVNAEPYGQFSPLYISKILNAYGTKSSETINELRKRQLQQERETNTQENLSPEEKLKQRKKWIIYYAEKVRTTDNYIGDYDNTIWTFLTRNNLLNPNDLSLKEASKYADMEIAKDNSERSTKVLFKAMNVTEQGLDIQKRREMYGRYYVMRSFFRKIPNINEWILSFDNQKILPSKTNK